MIKIAEGQYIDLDLVESLELIGKLRIKLDGSEYPSCTSCTTGKNGSIIYHDIDESKGSGHSILKQDEDGNPITLTKTGHVEVFII
jgi:hypothetical protein